MTDHEKLASLVITQRERYLPKSWTYTGYKQTNKQTINHHSVEVKAETSSKIATMAINVPIGDTLSSVANCRSTDQ